MKLPWPKQTLLAMASFAVIITVPQLVPQLYNWRVYEWSTASQLFDFLPRSRASAPVEEELERLRPDTVPVKPQESRIQDSNGEMDSFYAALMKTEKRLPGAVTRILHYGDSPTTGDLISADVRSFLQLQFGDAGHGTYLIAKPWAWYQHRGVDVKSSGWKMDPATLKGQKDGFYGLGGVSFTGKTGAQSAIALNRPGHSRMTLSYFAQPEGGEVVIEADEVHVATVDTSAPQAAVAEQTFPIPPEAREITMKVTRGPARLFCVTFRKDEPGVIYDSIGLNGAWAGVLSSHINGEHWREQLKAAQPSLVIINYGTNESGYRNYVETGYPKDMREIVRRVRTAVPEASVLIMSPMDRGTREKGGAIGTVPALPELVAVQARLAADNHCAFFNTFQAMGGTGTMGRWYMAEPRLVSADFIHPMPQGARIVGTLLYQALLDGYNRYKLKLLRQNLAKAN